MEILERTPVIKVTGRHAIRNSDNCDTLENLYADYKGQLILNSAECYQAGKWANVARFPDFQLNYGN